MTTNDHCVESSRRTSPGIRALFAVSVAVAVLGAITTELRPMEAHKAAVTAAKMTKLRAAVRMRSGSGATFRIRISRRWSAFPT